MFRLALLAIAETKQTVSQAIACKRSRWLRLHNSLLVLAPACLLLALQFILEKKAQTQFFQDGADGFFMVAILYPRLQWVNRLFSEFCKWGHVTVFLTKKHWSYIWYNMFKKCIIVLYTEYWWIKKGYRCAVCNLFPILTGFVFYQQSWVTHLESGSSLLQILTLCMLGKFFK